MIIDEGIGVPVRGSGVWGGGSIPWGSFGDVEDGGRSYCERDEEESEMGESAGEEDVEQSDVIDKEPEEDGVE